MRSSFRLTTVRFFESDWFQQLPPEQFDADRVKSTVYRQKTMNI